MLMLLSAQREDLGKDFSTGPDGRIFRPLKIVLTLFSGSGDLRMLKLDELRVLRDISTPKERAMNVQYVFDGPWLIGCRNPVLRQKPAKNLLAQRASFTASRDSKRTHDWLIEGC